MNFPEEFRYTNDHEFVKVENGIGIIGITDYAQKELGDIIYLDITTQIGETVSQGATLGTIEAVKTVSEVFSPISGNIIEINTAINDAPAKINEDPYGEGWIVKIKIAKETEISNLLDVTAYKQLIGV